MNLIIELVLLVIFLLLVLAFVVLLTYRRNGRRSDGIPREATLRQELDSCLEAKEETEYRLRKAIHSVEVYRRLAEAKDEIIKKLENELKRKAE